MDERKGEECLRKKGRLPQKRCGARRLHVTAEAEGIVGRRVQGDLSALRNISLSLVGHELLGAS